MFVDVRCSVALNYRGNAKVRSMFIFVGYMKAIRSVV